MTPSEAREVLNKMLNYSTEIGLLVDSGNYDIAHEAIEIAIAALEKSETPIFCNLDKPKVIRKDDGKLFEVWKILFNADGTTSVWCGEWSGHHKIGVDCEFEPAPVYHYLPEVPEDNESVIGFWNDRTNNGFQVVHFINQKTMESQWETEDDDDVDAPYAWTRIPPKPPIKPTEEQPRVCPLCDGKGRRVFPNCTPPIDKPCEGCEGAGTLQTINEKGGSHE